MPDTPQGAIEEAAGTGPARVVQIPETAASRGIETALLAGGVSASGEFLTIERPPPGQTRIVDIAGARHLSFNFSFADCVVQVLDVDAVLTFRDGGRLIMPTLAMQIVTAEPPKLIFAQALVDGQALLASAGDVRLSDQIPQLAISDTARTDTPEPPQPQVVQLPSAQAFSNTPGPSTRPVPVIGTGEGDALQDSNGRYARRVNLDESQSSSLKGEGALTERTNKVGTEAVAPKEAAAEATRDNVGDPTRDPTPGPAPIPPGPNTAPRIVSLGGVEAADVDRTENTASIARIVGSDADTGDLLTYAIAGGRDGDLFSINSINGELYFVATPDFELPANGSNDYEVIVAVSDGTDHDTQALTVHVRNVNEAPTGATINSSIVIENVANGTVVGRVTGADPDTGAVLSYGFAPGGDAGGRFAIDAVTGEVSVLRTDLIDFESSPTQLIVVRVTDEGGLSLDTPIVLSVSDANDTPVITSNGGGPVATLSVPENVTVVTTVTAVDVDAGSVLTYRIAGGGDAAQFTIGANTGVLQFVSGRDFETPLDQNGDNSYEVIVEVSDGLGGIDLQTLTVAVVDGNEIPATLVLTASTVAENSPNGTTVGFAVGTDPDPGDVLSYSLVPGGDAAGRFVIDATTGEITVADGSRLDFETNASHVVIVRATDLGGLSIDRAFTIALTNVNETPVIISAGGGPTATLSVAENSGPFNIVTALDPDAGASVTYSIVGGADAARFSLNPLTGTLSFIVAPDFEAPDDADGDNNYQVIVQASDGTLADTQSLSVLVTNQGEAPVITSDGGGSSALLTINEGQIAITTVSAIDPDASATLSYAIVGGADGARFVIDAATGVLQLVAPPDFESPTDAGGNNTYEVLVQASDGALTDTQLITVTVANLNDLPVIVSNGGGATGSIMLMENGTSVTSVLATDGDLGAVLTYTIAGGADAGRFTINASTGALSFLAAPNFEAPTDAGADNIYDVIVQVLDGAGGTDSQALSVTVTNQNEAPIITSNGGGAAAAISLAENGTSVATVTAVDPDAGVTLTYSLAGGADAALFTIDAATGVLNFIAPPDFDAPADAGGNNIYDVIVQVSDGLGGLDTQSIAVTLTNLNEAPVITSNGGGAAAAISLAENGTAVTMVTAVDPDAGATLTYSLWGGADAALFTINATTGVLSFLAPPDFETPTDVDADNVYDVIVQVSDGLGGLDTQAIAVTVTNQNEAPVITSNGGGATGSISIAESGTGVTAVTATDPDGGATLTYSLAGGADAALFTINATTGVLSFLAPPDFETPTDAGADNVYDVTVQVSDGLGGIDTQAIAVTVTNQNEAPVITSNGGGATGSISLAENLTAVTTVTATDPDGGATLSYSLSGGADAALFTINATTGVLSFLAPPDFEAPSDVGADNVYDVNVQVSDGLGGIDTQAIAVTVTNQNEAPAITSNGGGATAAVSIAENGTSVAIVTAVDPDAGATLSYSLAGGADAALFTINATTGVLTFVAPPDFDAPADAGGNNVYDVIVQVSDGLGGIDTQSLAVTITDSNDVAPVITSNGGGAAAALSIVENVTAVTTVTAIDPDTVGSRSYTFVGGTDAARFAINATTGVLTFIAAPDFDIPGDVDGDNVYDVIVQVFDGVQADTQAIAVTVTNQNEAPAITSNGGGATAAISLAENGTGVTTVTAVDPDGGATLTYSLSGGADAALFTINATTGVLSFLAPPDFETPSDAGADNVYDVVVQVSDGLGGIDTQSIAVTLTNQNEAPAITSNGGGAAAAISQAENGTAVTMVTAVDPDAGAVLAYSLAGGADAALFTINATTGVLSFLAPPDFEVPTDVGADNVYDVVVQVSDGLGGIDTQSIAVTLTNLNEAPIITSNGGGAAAAISLAENGTSVATVTAVDPDAGVTLTYSLAGGADAALFTIDAATGVLNFIAPPDFDAPADAGGNNIYDVIVQVSDGLGGLDTQSIAVTLTNLNEAPVITSNGGGAAAAISLAENGTAVTMVTAVDPDAGATLTYSLSGGADAALFTINATTGVLSFLAPPDFETPTDVDADNVYDVIVQVSDGLGGLDTQAIAVTVTNQNEAPVITSNGGGATGSISIAESGTGVTAVTATDPDGGATLTYSLAGGADAALFTINATTGVLSFLAPPDFETPTDAGADNVYDVTVQVSDGLGGIDTQAIAVTVTNQNEAPVITSNGGGATGSISLAENLTAVTTVTATDPDGGATLSYSLSGGADAALFTINATTGVLSFLAPPDFEAPSDVGADNVYDVNVQVSDGLGGIDTQAIAVTVTNQNEAPAITSNGGGATAAVSIAENGTSVAIVTAVDPDAGATLSYSLAGGADAALFTINATTGVLTFVAPPDFDAPADAGGNNIYDVIVQVSDGLGGLDTQSIAVTLTNLNEAPVITSNGGGAAAAISLAENGTAVTMVTAVDPDAGAVLAYSLAGGADAALFTINATTGVLSFLAPPDFETPTDVDADNVYDVIVQVSDGLGGLDTQAIAVTVTNQNEAPVITSNGGGATGSISIAESGTGVTAVTATDPDGGATLTYSLAGGADAALFTINATTGVLSFLAPPDFETPSDAGADNVYDVVVQVSDGLGGIDTQSIAVTVTDIVGFSGVGTAGPDFADFTGAYESVHYNGLAGDDTISGSAFDDVLSGGADNDLIFGGDGNDVIEGGPGNDTLDGGAGNDRLDYSNSFAAVDIDLATNIGIDGMGGTDTLSNFERVSGSAFDDTIRGNASRNTIEGGAGSDALYSNGGNDVLDGGDGDDSFTLQTGELNFAQTDVQGGNGFDSVILQGTGTVTSSELADAVSGVEYIDFSSAGAVAALTDFTAANATSILGASGPGNDLVLDLDVNDTFSVAAGEYFTQASTITTFYSDAGLTNEIARVVVV